MLRMKKHKITGHQADAIDLLKSVVMILEYQSKPSLANQGQCLDGFSALANYNSIAEKIKKFLKANQKIT